MSNLTNREIKRVMNEVIKKTDIIREAFIDDRRKTRDRRTDKEKRIEWAMNKALNGRR